MSVPTFDNFCLQAEIQPPSMKYFNSSVKIIITKKSILLVDILCLESKVLQAEVDEVFGSCTQQQLSETVGTHNSHNQVKDA